MGSDKTQITQRLWEQINRLQFALYVFIFISIYIAFSMANDTFNYNRAILEVSDIRKVFNLIKSEKLANSDKVNQFFLLETTYFRNIDTSYSWFYRSDLPLKGIPRYQLVRVSDITQFSHSDSFLWGDKPIYGHEIFNSDVKTSKGLPIKWNSVKYKNIENIKILEIINNANEIFQQKLHTPAIDDLIFVAPYKSDISTGKEINIGAISYLIKDKISLNNSKINKVSSDGHIEINSTIYRAPITDVTTQDFYYFKENEEYYFVAIMGFGLGNNFGIIDYATLSSTFSSTNYVFERDSKKFVNQDLDNSSNYFKETFPVLHGIFFVDYEKSRNPTLGEIEGVISELIEKKEKISIPLVGVSFLKADAGKAVAIIISVLWIVLLLNYRRLKDSDYASLPIIEIPTSLSTDYLVIRFIKIVIPLTSTTLVTTLIVYNYRMDYMVITSIVLILISLVVFFRTFKLSRDYWLLIRA